jgi:hypothetical protein
MALTKTVGNHSYHKLVKISVIAYIWFQYRQFIMPFKVDFEKEGTYI